MIIPRLEVAVVRAGVQGFSPAALRRARGRQHLSLRQLSLLSGVSFATISEWETSRALPPPSHLAAVANALGITVADVVPIKETHLVLADLRHHAGLTQQAAADAFGLKRSMYRAIDTGTRAADAQQRTQHAQLYSITTNQFEHPLATHPRHPHRPPQSAVAARPQRSAPSREITLGWVNGSGAHNDEPADSSGQSCGVSRRDGPRPLPRTQHHATAAGTVDLLTLRRSHSHTSVITLRHWHAEAFRRVGVAPPQRQGIKASE